MKILGSKDQARVKKSLLCYFQFKNCVSLFQDEQVKRHYRVDA